MMSHQGFQEHDRRRRSYTTLSRVLVIGLYLSGCTYPSVAPTQGPVPTFVTLPPSFSPSTTASPSDTPTNTPIIATLTSEPSMTSPPPTPSCGAPAGWVIYTVRPGDNLFRLGLKTGTTVDEIKFANCLVSDDISAGATLYLPFIPPVDTPIPPTSIQPSPCPSALSCPTPGLPSLVLAPGGPNEGAFIPCDAPSDEPWIDTRSPFGTELGTRRFFFACDFPSAPTSASVKLSDGSVLPMTLLGSLPNPDLSFGNAQAAIEWLALPTYPTGSFTLTILYTDVDGTQKPKDFPYTLEVPTQKHILVNPISGSPGTNFQVYFVCFDLTPTLFGLYGEDQPVIGSNHTLTYRGFWTVRITQPLSYPNCPGWVQTSLASSPLDRPAAYSITYGNQNEIFDLFWLR